ncbi:MAG: hypothetical protein O7E51_06970 [Acidobacteria bacterium]|nr:hypothetical protein [Acidobacteriota bacterium]
MTKTKMTEHARTVRRRAVWLAGLLLCLGGFLHAQSDPNALPEGDGKELVAAACTQCHSLSPIRMLRDGREGWKEMVHEMVLRGAQLGPEEADTVIRYLARNFGPGMSPMQTGPLPPETALGGGSGAETGDTVSLPPGDGKDMVEARCRICHDLGRVVTARRTRAEWEQITKNMMGRGPTATPEQIQTMVSYLTAQFGK